MSEQMKQQLDDARGWLMLSNPQRDRAIGVAFDLFFPTFIVLLSLCVGYFFFHP